MYTLVDVKKRYTVNLEIYSDKELDGPFLQKHIAFDVVDRLEQAISKTTGNIKLDNWFTSVGTSTKRS